MKKIFPAIAVFSVLFGCATSGSNGPQPNLYTLVSESAARHYGAWIMDSEPDSGIMYYSDKGNYRDLPNNRNAMSTGWIHFIYYNNKTKFKNLYSVLFLGHYSGNPEKEFTFSVENMRGEVLYQSSKHTFGEFPKASDTPAVKEYVVDLKNTPKELVIKLKTGSNPTDSLFIGVIPNEKNFFSYEFLTPYSYKRYEKSNAAIFPRFK